MLALEVWNEPNLPRFFAPRPSPPLYSRLLGAANRAARLSGVPVTLVTGGLTTGVSRAAGGIPAPRFLTRIYQLTGKASFDGIGSHPYPQGRPWVGSMTASLDQLRRVRDRFRDGATPLWITEVGIGGTSARRREGSVGLARQGPILARMYRSTQRSDVRAFIIYALRDWPTEGPKFEPFGVVGADLRPKPAYCYLASHLGGNARVEARSDRSRVALGWLTERFDLKGSLLTAIVVGSLAFASVASAVPTQIQVDDDFYAPAAPAARNLSSGASFHWQRAPGASLRTTFARTSALQFRRPDERADQLLRRRLGRHLRVLLQPARLAERRDGRRGQGSPDTQLQPCRAAVHGFLGSAGHDHRQPVRRPIRVGTTGPWTFWRNDTAARSGVFGQNGQPVQVLAGRTYQFRARSQKTVRASPAAGRRSGWSTPSAP